MSKFFKRVECWFRESHSWTLHWEEARVRGNSVQILTGSECLRCGKYRAA